MNEIELTESIAWLRWYCAHHDDALEILNEVLKEFGR
jgi:hypothetical protein